MAYLAMICWLVMPLLLEAQTTPNISSLGRAATAEEIQAWDTAVSPEGKELPPGSGTAKEGARLFAQKCAPCHGPNGEGASQRALVGGIGTLASENPKRTVGSYWPYATTVWDYIYRAMPQLQEGSLKPDEVYAITAFILFKNNIIKENDVMDAKTLPKVRMPNRDGFVPAKPVWPPR